MIKNLLILVVFYFLILLQSSFLPSSFNWPVLLLIFITVIISNVFESRERFFGLFLAFFSGLFLDLFSGSLQINFWLFKVNFFGIYALSFLLIAFFIKYFIRQNVRFGLY